jgi:hypothetical protein
LPVSDKRGDAQSKFILIILFILSKMTYREPEEDLDRIYRMDRITRKCARKGLNLREFRGSA